MIRAFRKDALLLRDIRAARGRVEPFHVWWLGQSGFLVQWENRHLLFDPYLSDSLTRKYAQTDKPHVRMTEQVLRPEELNFIDVTTSSHNHTDHLDKETLQALLRVNPRMELVIPEANREFVVDRLETIAELPRGMDAGQTIQVGGFEIHAVPAAHESLARDDGGRHQYLGYVVQFGVWSIYHSGDTVLYPGLEDWLKRWPIDLALLPINGRSPERRVAGNLNGREAAELAHAIGAGCVIPCHYDMFEFNTAATDEFVECCQRLNQPFQVLRAGERWSAKTGR